MKIKSLKDGKTSIILEPHESALISENGGMYIIPRDTNYLKTISHLPSLSDDEGYKYNNKLRKGEADEKLLLGIFQSLVNDQEVFDSFIHTADLSIEIILKLYQLGDLDCIFDKECFDFFEDDEYTGAVNTYLTKSPSLETLIHGLGENNDI